VKGDNFLRSAQAADFVRALEADECPFDPEHPEWYTDEDIAHWRWRHIDDWEAREEVISLHEPGIGRRRAKLLVEGLEQMPTASFWSVFLNAWPGTCGSWPYQPRLLEMLRHHAEQEPAIDYMQPAAIEFFDELPPVVTAFRGCDCNRVLGLSWSPSLRLAKQYADREHLSDPVIATAKIRRSSIFAVCIEENCEIVVDPKCLRELQLRVVKPQR
jgi:hypothetical protein